VVERIEEITGIVLGASNAYFSLALFIRGIDQRLELGHSLARVCKKAGLFLTPRYRCGIWPMKKRGWKNFTSITNIPRSVQPD
jgi:hypothetical protein